MSGSSALIDLANEKVSITDVLGWAGVYVPETFGRSVKVECPWGHLFHSDGGIDRSMRVYSESNSAFCFSCSVFYTPVRLHARANDIDEKTAAGDLLDHIGYRPPEPLDVWAEVTTVVTPKPDRTLLAEALKYFCARTIPQWHFRQLEQPWAGVLSRCLHLLDQVGTEQDAEHWLTTCKTVMGRVRLQIAEQKL